MNDFKEKFYELEKKVIELTNKLVNMEAKRIEPLRKVGKAMSRRVLSLENKIEDMKKNKISSEGAKEPDVS